MPWRFRMFGKTVLPNMAWTVLFHRQVVLTLLRSPGCAPVAGAPTNPDISQGVMGQGDDGYAQAVAFTPPGTFSEGTIHTTDSSFLVAYRSWGIARE